MNLETHSQLAPNLNSYINGFSKNVREIMGRFAFDQQIARMAEKNLFYEVIKAFSRIDLSLERVDSIRKFSRLFDRRMSRICGVNHWN
jgi:type I restriction enzyme M protein